jgi:hypothetical protein
MDHLDTIIDAARAEALSNHELSRDGDTKQVRLFKPEPEGEGSGDAGFDTEGLEAPADDTEGFEAPADDTEGFEAPTQDTAAEEHTQDDANGWGAANPITTTEDDTPRGPRYDDVKSTGLHAMIAMMAPATKHDEYIKARDITLSAVNTKELIFRKKELEEIQDKVDALLSSEGAHCLYRVVEESDTFLYVRDDGLRVGDDGTIEFASVDPLQGLLEMPTTPSDDNVNLYYDTEYMDIFPNGVPEDVIWAPFSREERGRRTLAQSGSSRPRALSVGAACYPTDTSNEPPSGAEFRAYRTALTKSFRDLANKHVGERAVTRDGGRPYAPTLQEVLREAYRVAQLHPTLRGLKMSNSVAERYRNYFRYTLHWDISLDRVIKCLLSRRKLISMGTIPVTDAARQASEEYIASTGIGQYFLPKTYEAKEVSTEPAAATDSNPKVNERKAKGHRAFLATKKPNLHSDFHRNKATPYVQKEDSEVMLNLRKDIFYKSYIGARFAFNYKDDTSLFKQPRRVVDVKFTHRNMRVPGDFAPEDNYTEDVFHEVHQLYNVTDEVYLPLLKDLFAHKLAEDPKYLEALQMSCAASGHDLWLLHFPHNERPFTANVFAWNDEVEHDDRIDLRLMLGNCPSIFLLIRGLHIDEIVAGIVDHFKILATYDPTSRYFHNPHQRIINNKSVVATSDISPHVVPAQYSFETYLEYETAVGMSKLIEQRWANAATTYNGAGACLIVPHSTHPEQQLPMVYVMITTVEYEKDQPRLMPGDAIKVDFSKDQSVSGKSWKGKVIPSTSASGLDTVTFVITRPVKDREILDFYQPGHLTADQIKNMAPSHRQQFIKQQKLQFKLHTKPDKKELKRIAYGLAKMHIPKKLEGDFPVADQVLEEARQLQTCNNHANYSQSSLYDGLKQTPLLTRAIDWVSDQLRDYQRAAVDDWNDGSVLANTIALGGPSGSGKTYTVVHMLAPHLLPVEITGEVFDAQTADNSHFLVQEEVQAQKDAQYAAERQRKAEEKKTLGKGKGKAVDHASEVQDESALATQQPEEPDKKPYTPKPEKTDEEKNRLEERRKTIIEVPGAVTICTVQNRSADNMFTECSNNFLKFAKDMDVAQFVGLRLYSENAELSAIEALCDPRFDFKPDVEPYLLDNSKDHLDTDYLGSVNQELLAAYLKAYQGSEYEGIKDKRFVDIKASAAYLIMALAAVPGFPLPSHVRRRLGSTEIANIRAQLSDLVVARNDIIAAGEMTDEIRAKIQRVGKLALRIVVKKASFIVTTLAVATSSWFNSFRCTTALSLEEAGRADCAETLALWSLYRFVKVRVFSGCWNQLTPMMLGPDLQNPYQSQGFLSVLARLHATGFFVVQFLFTARFANKQLLEVCRIVNRMADLQAVEGSFNDAATATGCAMMNAVWQVSKPVVLVNIVKAMVQSTSTGSKFCMETAVAVMFSLLKRLRDLHMQGKDITIIYPYIAQGDLYAVLLRVEIKNAIAANNVALANELKAVQLSTIDSFMGLDCNHIFLDTVNHPGFFFNPARFLVGCTRARVSMEIYIDTLKFTKDGTIKNSHVFHQLVDLINKDQAVVRLPTSRQRQFEQYNAARAALGLALDASSNRILPALGMASDSRHGKQIVDTYDGDEQDREYSQALRTCLQEYQQEFAEAGVVFNTAEETSEQQAGEWGAQTSEQQAGEWGAQTSEQQAGEWGAQSEQQVGDGWGGQTFEQQAGEWGAQSEQQVGDGWGGQTFEQQTGIDEDGASLNAEEQADLEEAIARSKRTLLEDVDHRDALAIQDNAGEGSSRNATSSSDPWGMSSDVQSWDNQADTGNVELTTDSTDGESSDEENGIDSLEEYIW